MGQPLKRAGRSTAGTWFAAVWALLAVACGPDGTGSGDVGVSDLGSDGEPRVCDPTACAGGKTGRLQLGQGVSDETGSSVEYEALVDGDEVEIVAGFQGGQHIWVILRAEDVETCFVTPRYEIIAEDGASVLDAYFGGEFYPLPAQSGTFEFLAYAAFVQDPEVIHRRPTTLRAQVSDGCGHLISDEVEVIPVDPRLGP